MSWRSKVSNVPGEQPTLRRAQRLRGDKVIDRPGRRGTHLDPLWTTRETVHEGGVPPGRLARRRPRRRRRAGAGRLRRGRRARRGCRGRPRDARLGRAGHPRVGPSGRRQGHRGRARGAGGRRLEGRGRRHRRAAAGPRGRASGVAAPRRGRLRAGRALPHGRRRRLLGRHPALLEGRRPRPRRHDRGRLGANARPHPRHAGGAGGTHGPPGVGRAHPDRRGGPLDRRRVGGPPGGLVDSALRRPAAALEGADPRRAERPRPRPRPQPLPPGGARGRGGSGTPGWPGSAAPSPAAGCSPTATRRG